jgi:uncharacterized iron-regulated membrane protein
VVRFRKWMILTHRYLGIGLSLLFVMWFISGIGMIFAGGMPELTPELRRERMPPLDLNRIRLSPSDAVAKAATGNTPGRVVLQTVLDRPAYRLYAEQSVTVFADTGELLGNLNQASVMAIASRFMNLPIPRLHHIGVLDSADQWTIGERQQMPLHKIAVDDAAHSELYVSPSLGEVVLHTTRGSRALAWAAAIPHWLYFTPLRVQDALWRQVVLWTSGIGVILAMVGIILGIIQFSPARPPGPDRARSYIPYSGWMRWHYVTGVVFGLFTLTWVFSGLLSMEPWDWVNRGGSGAPLRRALAGGLLDLAQFPPIEATAWNQVLPAHAAREVEFLRIQGNPYYAVRGADPGTLLLAVNPLRPRRESFSIESVMGRVQQASAGEPIVETRLLSGYDAYYYTRSGRPPLPVLRVKFDDPEHTWVYIDPAMSRVVTTVTRQERLERWLYHGLHSLDFAFWYYNRPLWDVGVIALCIGGAASSAIGLFVGYRRLARHVKRPNSRPIH